MYMHWEGVLETCYFRRKKYGGPVTTDKHTFHALFLLSMLYEEELSDQMNTGS